MQTEASAVHIPPVQKITASGTVISYSLRLILPALGLLLVSGCGGAQPGDMESRRERAWSWFQQNEYNTALQEFSTLYTESPDDSTIRQEALFAQAKIWHVRPNPRKNLPLAQSLYREALAVDPDSDLAPWILMGLARIRVIPVGGEPAPVDVRVDAYRELIERFPRHPAGEEAFLLQQAALIEVGTAETFLNVRDALREFIDTRPDSPWRSHAWMMVSTVAVRLNDPALRLKALLRAEETRETDPLGTLQDMADLYWGIATTAQYDLGDFPVAREYYHRFIDEYPTQQRVFLAKQALEQMKQVENRLRDELTADANREVSP
ncbi:MAG: tetratricopeptide repeat protein [Verrucomicrobia bacterium]|nr:tetratricopeptide repeat protein [Verrucomicrobiota bacterium]MCH8527532.1 tetratricopeptide repeat protein [Kiritimatiellia bacterium]